MRHKYFKLCQALGSPLLSAHGLKSVRLNVILFFTPSLLKRGILQIDQELALDNSIASSVSGFASNGIRFQKNFAKAMVKLGSIEVLVGKAGEIRKNCRVFNLANQKKPIRAF